MPNQERTVSTATSRTVLGETGAMAVMRATFDIPETVCAGFPNPVGDSFDSRGATLLAYCGRGSRASVSGHRPVEAVWIDTDPG